MDLGRFQGIAIVAGCVLGAAVLFWLACRLLAARFLRKMGASTLARSPENLSIFLSLERLSRRAGLAVPTLYLLDDYSPNAFALRSRKGGAVVLTEGLLQVLTQEELEAVLGLCLAQLRLKAFRSTPIAAVIALPFTALSARLPLAFAILCQSIASVVVRLLVTPERMFAADAYAAEIVQNPDQIALSLRKLTSLSRRVPLQHHDVALDHMFVVSAVNDELIASACATHPEPEQRIRRLLDVSLSC